MSDSFLKNVIKSYPDFPKKGILFRDVLPILENPDVFGKLIKNMSNAEFFEHAEAIIGVDARGFIFAAPLALKLNIPLILARKPGKLPGDLIENSYDLEYGSNSLSLQKEALKPYKNFVIVDDLLATGGTVGCIKEIISKLDKNVLGISVVVELTSLNARSSLNLPIMSEIKY